MTERQALTEARKRWGKTAWTEKRETGQLAGRRMVGRVEMGFVMVRGIGDNWSAAFLDSDQ